MGDFTDGIERLEFALDEERNGYLEWHDGPDYSSVVSAVSVLTPDEQPRAVEMVIRRLEKGYTVYLGQAAMQLGRETDLGGRIIEALESLLDRSPNTFDAANIARNILELGPSSKAVEMFRRIVREGPGWYAQIEALCNLKSAVASRGNRSVLEEIFTPELAETVLDAVRDDDYLTRYHAADLLRKAAGIRQELSEDKRLFPLICGSKSSNDTPPADADRAGFEQAAGILRTLYPKTT